MIDCDCNLKSNFYISAGEWCQFLLSVTDSMRVTVLTGFGNRTASG